MTEITRYKNLDYLLQEAGLPLAKTPDFYIFKLDDVADIEIDMGSHSHNFFEISFSTGYDLDIYIGHQKKNVLEGTLWFLSPNQLINWDIHSICDNNISYTILFKPELLPFTKGSYTLYNQFPFFNRNTKATYHLTSEQKNTIIRLMNDLYVEHKNFGEDSLQLIISHLSILLFTCKRELNIEKNLINKRTRPEEITLQFENLVQQSTNSKQSIKYFADKLNVSSVYLSECIKKITGKTTKQIIDEYLIIEAKSVLKHSSKSIAQIAMDLGFDDKSNFGKYFKKHTGMSPVEYQNT